MVMPKIAATATMPIVIVRIVKKPEMQLLV